MHTAFRVVSHMYSHQHQKKKKKPNVFVTLLKKNQSFNKEERMRKTKVPQKIQSVRDSKRRTLE